MGMFPSRRNCRVYGTVCDRVKKTVINKTVIINNKSQPFAPNPINFDIIDVTEVNGHVIAKIHYPDCTNYEGMKICLFLNTNIKEFMEQKTIDPHFAEEGFSPFARFKPDIDGWRAAFKLANQIKPE